MSIRERLIELIPDIESDPFFKLFSDDKLEEIEKFIKENLVQDEFDEDFENLLVQTSNNDLFSFLNSFPNNQEKTFETCNGCQKKVEVNESSYPVWECDLCGEIFCVDCIKINETENSQKCFKCNPNYIMGKN